MKKQLLMTFVLLLFALVQVWAQEREIRGKIIDPNTGDGIPGVSVFVKGTTIGTVSNADGSYQIRAGNDAILVFQSVGFNTQEITVGSQSSIDVNMVEDVKSLNEIVVTAVAIEREKKEIGYAIEQIKGGDVVNARETNIVNGLAGKFTGVQITNSSGQVGSSSRIVVRGAASLLGNNQPLFVIDGVPMDNSQNFGGGQFSANGTGAGDSPLFFGGTTNRAIDIDPNIVESISVLKGASATALYGQRGANGVILVTTKKGEIGTKMKFSYGINYGFSEARLQDFQEVYAQGLGGVYFSGNFNNGTNASWGPRLDTLRVNAQGFYDPNGEFAPKYNNREDFFRTGQSYDHNFNLSGGTTKGSYFASYTYKTEDGIVPGNSLKRHNITAKFSTELSPKLSASVSMNYTNTRVDAATEGNGQQSYLWQVWRAPISYNLRGDTLFFPNGTQRSFSNTFNNPYFVVEKNGRTSSVDRFQPNLTFTYKLFPWLSFLNRFGADIYTDQVDYREAIGTIGTFNTGRMYNDRNIYRQLNNEFLITFNKKLGENINLNAILGNQINEIYNNRAYVQGATLSVPEFYHVSNASVVSSRNQSSLQRLVSVYAQATIGFKEYAFLSISGRNDISSTLPSENRSFFYPSASLSFVVTEAIEGLQNNPILSFAKIRVGAAEVGASAGPYNTQTEVFVQSGINDGQRGLINIPYNNINSFTLSNALGNPNLRPERTKEIEAGLELEFFKKRLGFEGSYYNRKTIDQIFQAPIAASSGGGSRVVNAGSIRNKGVELLLRGTPLKSDNFSWDITLTYTRNKNEVAELIEGVESIRLGGFTAPGIYILRGQPYGIIWGSRYQRGADGRYLVGNNGLPLVGPNLGAIGNTQPDWLGSARNTFSYNNARIGRFALSVLFDTRQGGDIMNLDNFYLIAAGLHPKTLDRDGSKSIIYPGTKPDGSENDIAIPLTETYWRTQFGQATAGEEYVEDGSFIRLREITFTYGLPKTFLKGMPFSAVDIAVTGRNLWLRAPNFTGHDPESSLYGSANGQGFYNFITPNTYGWNFALNITF